MNLQDSLGSFRPAAGEGATAVPFNANEVRAVNGRRRSTATICGLLLGVTGIVAALAAAAGVAAAAAGDGRTGRMPAAERITAAGRERHSARTFPAKAGVPRAFEDRDLLSSPSPVAGTATAELAPLSWPSDMRPGRAARLARTAGAVLGATPDAATGPGALGSLLAAPLASAGTGGGDLPAQPQAAPWSAAALLADPNHSNDQYLAMAVAPSGALYAVFESYDLGSTDRDIHIARSIDQGATWSVWEMPSFTLDESMPDLAIDAAGYLHVVWVRSDGVLVRARSAATDDPASWAFVRGLELGTSCATPSVAVSGSGDFARLFVAASIADYGEWTLFWMWSTTGGTTVSYDYYYADGYPDLWPDVALDGATAYLVNGEQDGTTGEIEILIAADAISGTFADVANLTDWTAMSCGFPSLAAQGENVFCVYQLDWDDGLGNIDGDIIYAFSWDGMATVYGPYELAADPRENVGPSVAARDGVVVAAYLDAPANGDEFRLVARAAGGDGHPDNWLPAEAVNDLATVEPSFRAAAAAVGTSHLHAVWSDRRDYPTQGRNIYRSRRQPRPNLAPFTPAGWGGPLVASVERGGRQTTVLAANDTAWVSLAFWNDGLTGAPQDIAFQLLRDGEIAAAWVLPGGLPTSTYVAVEDHPLVLGPGSHDLELRIDVTAAVVEEDETDNAHLESVWCTREPPRLALRPAQIAHVFPAGAAKSAAATVQLAADPPLRRQVWTPVVSADLAQALAAAPDGERLRVVVTPAARVDALAAREALAPLDRGGARAALAGALRAESARAAAALAAAHGPAIARGGLSEPAALWLSGELAVQADAAAIAELATDPAVGRLWLDDRPSAPLGALATAATAATAPAAARAALVPRSAAPDGTLAAAAGGALGDDDPLAEPLAEAWHLARIGATTAWGQGLDGDGVLIGHLDTGAAYDHPDLAAHFWDGGAAYPHHGWDSIGDDNDPYDGDTQYWHGTHTAGLIVGDGAGGTTTGAAPGAHLLVLRCVPGYYQDLVEALQFAVDHGCVLLTMSAGWSDPSAELRAALRQSAEALLALGIPWFCAAGNGDNAGGHLPVPRDLAAPGDCPEPVYGSGGHTAVITVTATDAADAVSTMASGGPTAWALADPPAYGDYPYPPGLVKPDLAAPGVAVTSTVGASGYASYTGTSMATPLAAAAGAILLQARPNLSPEQIAAALAGGAVDLGAAGRDNQSGAGRLDIPASLVLLPETGAEVFWVRNDGPLPLEIAGVSWASAWLAIAPLHARIAPRDSLRFTATFDPAGLSPGTHWDEVVFACNDPAAPRLSVSARVGDDLTTGAPDDGPARPAAALGSHPNPFNPRTILSFANRAAGPTRLTLHDLAGRRVRTLVAGDWPAGEHQVVWDGTDDGGAALPSGVYLARLVGAGGAVVSRKLTLLR